MSPLLAASACLMGLFGSTHCVVMCGGVVAMTCSALPLDRRKRSFGQLPYTLAYNAGRIASYASAGAVAGLVGATVGSFGAVERAALVLRLAAGLLMLLVGAYVAGLASPLRWIEAVGAPVWRRVRPLALRMVPLRSVWAALGLGLLWGWMPCGLVYAALVGAVASGSAAAGAGTMLAFGLGTLPMLLAMGSAATMVARAARVRWVRTTAGVAIVAFAMVHLATTGQAWAAMMDGDPHLCSVGQR